MAVTVRRLHHGLALSSSDRLHHAEGVDVLLVSVKAVFWEVCVLSEEEVFSDYDGVIAPSFLPSPCQL